MKTAVFVLALASFAAAGAASAGSATDLDYLKAARCKGLATTLAGVVDPNALNAYMKANRAGRHDSIYDRADAEFDRAKREARAEDRKVRLTAELTGPCMAYAGSAQDVAKR